MPVKRKLRTGLATNILCVLKHEGKAPSRFFARRFGYSESTIDRVLDKLEQHGLAQMAMGGDYFLTSKGSSKVYRSKACGSVPKRFAVTRAHSDAFYVPLRGARRRRRR